MRGERERRDGRDRQKHRLMYEPKYEVRGGEVRNTSNFEPRTSVRLPVSLVSRESNLCGCSGGTHEMVGL